LADARTDVVKSSFLVWLMRYRCSKIIFFGMSEDSISNVSLAGSNSNHVSIQYFKSEAIFHVLVKFSLKETFEI
jgi:hypothetical protein